jgi:hypothetical protein
MKSRQACLSLAAAASLLSLSAAGPSPARDVQAALDAYLTSASQNGATLLQDCAENGYLACCSMRDPALPRRAIFDKAVRAAKAGMCDAAVLFVAETQCNNDAALSLILHHRQDVCSKLVTR